MFNKLNKYNYVASGYIDIDVLVFEGYIRYNSRKLAVVLAR